MEIPKDWWKTARLLLTLLFLIPIWLLPYLPLNDLPNHIASAHLLIAHYAGKCDYIVPNASLLVPNLSSSHFMVFVGQFIGADAAARLLLSLYVISLPLTLAYFLRAIGPELEQFSLAAFAVMFNWFFSMGFLNFVVSLPIFLFAAGFYLKIRGEKFDIANAIFISLLGLLLYFTHLAAFAAFASFLAICALLLKLKSPSDLKSLKLEAFALVPAGLLLLAYLASSPPSLDASQIVYGTLARKLSYLPAAFPNPALTFIFLLVLGARTLPTLAKEKLPGVFTVEGAMAISSLVFFAAFFLVPENLPNWQFASPRALPFAFMFAFAVFASALSKLRELSGELVVVLAIFALVSLAASAFTYVQQSGQISEIAALSAHFEKGASVFPFGMGFTYSKDTFTEPLLHTWGYWVLQKETFSPYLFSLEYSPLHYQSGEFRGVAQINSWLERLAYESFTHSGATSICSPWDNYYSNVNWSLISQNYDYLVFRPGKCDANFTPPSIYSQIYNGSGGIVYKK